MVDDDDISNITFSGDDSNGFSSREWKNRKDGEPLRASTRQNPCCEVQAKPTTGKTVKIQQEQLQQKRRTGHFRVQRERKNIFNGSANRGNCPPFSVPPQTHETLKRATAAAALANEAQKLAQLRAQARWEEERNKPFYRGGTRLRRRRKINGKDHCGNKAEENLSRQKKPPWDNSIQPLVGEGTLKIRNRKECNATALVERQQRQLALRLKALEREEALHLEAKQSLEARRAKANVSSTITIRKNNKEVEPKHRQQLEMQDRGDGQVERTYTETKVKITPSQSNAFACLIRQTRATSPFDDQIIDKLLASDPSDEDPTNATASQHDMAELLREKQMQLLEGIERQLRQLRLLDEKVEEKDFGFQVANYCNDKLAKYVDVEDKFCTDNTPVIEVSNETDDVSFITTQPLPKSLGGNPPHPSQEEYFYWQLKQYMDYKKCTENRGDDKVEVQSNILIEL